VVDTWWNNSHKTQHVYFEEKKDTQIGGVRKLWFEMTWRFHRERCEWSHHHLVPRGTRFSKCNGFLFLRSSSSTDTRRYDPRHRPENSRTVNAHCYCFLIRTLYFIFSCFYSKQIMFVHSNCWNTKSYILLQK
jgi:hypothetical protein